MSIVDFEKHKDDLLAVLREVEPQGDWCTQEETISAAERTIEQNRDIYEILQGDAEFVLNTKDGSEDQSNGIAHLFRSWHVGFSATSLPAVVTYAADTLGLKLLDPVRKALMIAALLGEIRNTPSYHSNMHFREVTFQMLRMILTHNNIYHGTSKTLSDENAALMLMSAAIHDLGHTGQGNTVDGQHVMAYLETRSYELIKPYFEVCGLNRSQIHKVRTMLFATDASPIADENSPMNQMKRMYDYHYLQSSKIYKPVLSEGLIMLEDNAVLTMMSLMLHEADISVSAGVNYDVTSYETSLLWQEMNREEPQPSDILNFLDKICGRRFNSDAGKRLFAANMARIYALAEDAVKNGNVPFPHPHHTDFILGISAEYPEGKPLN